MSTKITIILCRPEISANIGAVCRVMANTDISDLRITGCKENYNKDEICKLALHAKGIWETARFFPPDVNGLKAASADCSVLAGTTRRTGQRRKNTALTPEALCAKTADFIGGRLGLVFGNERTGLTDAELDCCSFSVNIPASRSFGSYNLSHAVLLLAYPLFTAQLKEAQTLQPSSAAKKAPLHLIRKNSEEICSFLKQLGMFKAGGKHENEIFFTELLSSAGAGAFEVNHLLEIFKKIFYLKTKP